MAFTFTEHFDARIVEIRSLMKTNITDLKEVYKARIFAPQNFPCACVEGSTCLPEMVTTDKYRMTYQVVLYWFTEGEPEEVADKACREIGDAILKLFSNNALGDIAGAHTGKYKTHGSFWYDSQLGALDYFGKQKDSRFTRMGLTVLTLYTSLIV